MKKKIKNIRKHRCSETHRGTSLCISTVNQNIYVSPLTFSVALNSLPRFLRVHFPVVKAQTVEKRFLLLKTVLLVRNAYPPVPRFL